MAADELESIMARAQRLSPQERMQLIEELSQMIAKDGRHSFPTLLTYGKYRDAPGHFSEEEDFRIAEWHPTETDLNGP
jgi:hypothetical protein